MNKLKSAWPRLVAGVVFCGLLTVLVAITSVTGRVAAAWYRPPANASRALWFAAALWRDVGSAMPVAALLTTVLLIPVLLANRRNRIPTRGLALVAIVAAATIWISAISFCEYWIQRGSLPVWHEFMGGMDAAFLKSALANFRYPRYVWPAIVAWPLIGLTILAALRWAARRVAAFHNGGFVVGFMASAALLFFFTHPAHSPPLPLPKALVEAEGVTDPFGRFFGSAWAVLTGHSSEPKQILIEAQIPANLQPEGASLLGLGFHPSSGSCAPHPFSSPLDQAPLPAVNAALQAISRELFTNNIGKDLLVFHISLESFRGDDMEALNPRAPAGIAPFFNGLYAQAAAGQGGVVASHSFWQGGVRTSQGMSAFTCGLGALPYGVSLVRDLGPVPLRCLSDVLTDAGFGHTFVYGSHPSFDGMSPFLRYHGFSNFVTQDELPKRLPLGEWDAVSDLALFDEALRFVERQPRAPLFTLMMSLSNHSPFTPPQDLPPVIRPRVKAALAAKPNHARPEDVSRLTTYSYADFALAAFFEKLYAHHLAERSIVIVHADHATGERYVWSPKLGPESETAEATARIPFAMVFPPPLVARAAHPVVLTEQIRQANAQINLAPTSLNDVPRWVLDLLSAHPGLAQLEQPWRWHTLGGMTSSTLFVPPAAHPARIYGISGINQLFWLNERGQFMSPVEDVMAVTTQAEVFAATRPLFPAAALWSEFLKGYAKTCPDERHIRRIGAPANGTK
ncbi:MAG: LTA synthase family protein [Deltaproteobacteria bacterium]|nr:LTA synthase family protein [Deltaproteobacteria bacterium]